MTELEGLILFWKTALGTHRYLLEPSVITHVENTVKHLEELQGLKGSSQEKDRPTPATR